MLLGVCGRRTGAGDCSSRSSRAALLPHHRCRALLPARPLRNRCVCAARVAAVGELDSDDAGVRRTGDMLASFDGDCHQAIGAPEEPTRRSDSPVSSTTTSSTGLFASVCALRAAAQAAENARKHAAVSGAHKRRAAESSDAWMLQPAQAPPARPLPQVHRIAASNNIVSMAGVGSSSSNLPAMVVLASAKQAAATETAATLQGALSPLQLATASPRPAAAVAAAACQGALSTAAAGSQPARATGARSGAWSDRKTRALRRALARLNTGGGSAGTAAGETS